MDDHPDPPAPMAMRRRPPASDPDEAIERVMQRKHLAPGDGDVLLFRDAVDVKNAEALTRYRVQILGMGPSSGSFATYEHAVAHAEQLAAQHRTRLFYAESRDTQPQLLKGRP